MLKTITVAPLGCQFSNSNEKMGLRPHQHYAEVTLTYRTTADLGFPVFEGTVDGLRWVLRAATERPFKPATNEDVADRLFEVFALTGTGSRDKGVPVELEAAFERLADELDGYGGGYELHALELAVMGVPDDIGHSEGFARYRIAAEAPFSS